MTWNCPAFVNIPLTTGMFSMVASSAFFGSFKTKRILVAQWVTADTFSLPPMADSNSLASLSYLPIVFFLLINNLYNYVSYMVNILYLIFFVNRLQL